MTIVQRRGQHKHQYFCWKNLKAMNVPSGCTHKFLQLVADRNINCFLCSFVRNASTLYDVNKQSEDSSRTDPKLLRPKRPLIGLAAPLLAFALGAWQVQRLQWKNNLLKKIEDKKKQEVIPFPDDNLSMLEDLEYARVTVTGEFLHDREFYVQPRPRYDKGKDDPKNRPTVGDFGSAGAQVVTPFKLHPSGLVILVNRGWIPPQRISPKSRAEGQVQGQVTFDAVVRHTEKRPVFIRRNDPDRDLWFYADIGQMAKKHGTLPILVDACYEATVHGGPIGGQTRVTHRNDHMMYACIWFSVAAATLYGWFL